MTEAIRPVQATSRATRALVMALFFVSGTSGLVFEVVWLKLLTATIGHTTFAVSVVVSSYLGGLLLGSLVIGRWADRVRRPLLAYAALEAAAGILAMALTALMRSLPEILGRVGLPGGGPLVLRALFAFLLVLPPTVVMGGTLPMLSRFVTRDRGALGRSVGTLYALNTLGAAVGCGLAGLWVVGALGLWQTARAAAVVNLAVAAMAGVLHRTARTSPLRTMTGPVPETHLDSKEQRSRRLRLMAAFVACGFVSISYEVLWFPVLESFIESSTYSFAVLMVTYLLGLVAGGFAFAWWLRRVAAMPLLAWVQIGLAASGLASMLLLGRSEVIGSALTGLLSLPGRAAYLGLLLHAGVAMLVPATLIGVVFPLTVQLVTERLAVIASRVGIVYALNTLGGVVGSLVTGFALVPLLGTQRSFLVLIGLSLVVAVEAAALSRAPRLRLGAWVAVAAVVAAAIAVPGGFLTSAYGRFTGGRPLWVREGRDGTMVVVQYDREQYCKARDCAACDPGEFRHRQMVFGSVSYANTVLPGKRYMRALAHLPMLVHRSPGEVLEVCFGSGTTAATFVSYPELRRLVVVDTNPDVFRAAAYFAEDNRGVLEDPRVQHHVDDGRHFLAADERRWDVISLEPPPPGVPGASELYTREFYELVRRKLAPGGFLTQWIPLEQQSDALDRQLVSAVLDVFPEVSMWIPSQYEAVLLASTERIGLDVDLWRVRWADPAVARSLEEIGFATPESLLGTWIAGTQGLRQWVGGHAAMTDDRPSVEYYLSAPGRAFDLGALLEFADDPGPRIAGVVDKVLLDSEVEASRMLLRANEAWLEGDTPRAKAFVAKAMRRVGANPFLDHLRRQQLGCAIPTTRRRAPAR